MSSGDSSSPLEKKNQIIPIRTTAGVVLQQNEDTENTRSKFLLANFENPKGSTQQTVLVELYKYSSQDLHSLKIMHDISHVNILRCYQYQKSDNSEYCRVFLEKFTGCLNNILEKRSKTLHHKKVCPSQTLTKLMRSIVDVLNFLHRKLLYHGALSWTTLLYLNVEGTAVVKLAHFCKKNGLSICKAQKEDWQAVAAMLQELADRFEGNSALYTDHLERAITFFQGIIEDQMSNIPILIEDLDLFWTSEDRQKYATKVFHWCENGLSCKQLEKSNLVLKPWFPFTETSGGNNLLEVMNNFKDKDGKNEKNLDYDGNSTVHFLKFISGIYAHSHLIVQRVGKLENSKSQFGGLARIDEFVCQNFPDLFYTLRKLQKRHNFI